MLLWHFSWSEILFYFFKHQMFADCQRNHFGTIFYELRLTHFHFRPECKSFCQRIPRPLARTPSEKLMSLKVRTPATQKATVDLGESNSFFQTQKLTARLLLTSLPTSSISDSGGDIDETFDIPFHRRRPQSSTNFDTNPTDETIIQVTILWHPLRGALTM